MAFTPRKINKQMNEWINNIGKVKSTLDHVMKTQRRSWGRALLSLGLRWGGLSNIRNSRFTPGKEIRYPLHRKLSGPQRRSGRVRKISPQPGFDPRTVQSVPSFYTDYDIPA
jgi:hypothetical protein